jgi:hypothetical protein
MNDIKSNGGKTRRAGFVGGIIRKGPLPSIFLKRLPGLDQSNRRSWASLADKSLQVFKNE